MNAPLTPEGAALVGAGMGLPPTVRHERRIAQIATADGIVYALDADGVMWEYKYTGYQWRRSAPLPSYEEVPAR